MTNVSTCTWIVPNFLKISTFISQSKAHTIKLLIQSMRIFDWTVQNKDKPFERDSPLWLTCLSDRWLPLGGALVVVDVVVPPCVWVQSLLPAIGQVRRGDGPWLGGLGLRYCNIPCKFTMSVLCHRETILYRESDIYCKIPQWICHITMSLFITKRPSFIKNRKL